MPLSAVIEDRQLPTAVSYNSFCKTTVKIVNLSYVNNQLNLDRM